MAKQLITLRFDSHEMECLRTHAAKEFMSLPALLKRAVGQSGLIATPTTAVIKAAPKPTAQPKPAAQPEIDLPDLDSLGFED